MTTVLDSVVPPRLSGLRRITSGGRFIPEIDGFRLLAILLVLNAHIHLQVADARDVPWPRWLMLPGSGTRGVLLFFTISGFILGLPFARRALLDPPEIDHRPFTYRAYLMRRVTRLEPPYLFTLLLRFILILVAFHKDMRELAPHFLASFFYVHNIVFGTMSPISPPTWSLEVEVQFYLLAPLLASVFLIRRAAFRRALLIVVTLSFALVVQIYFSTDQRVVLSLAGNLQYFSVGLLLCDFFVTRPFRDIPTYVWDLLGVGALVPLLWIDSRWTLILFPFGALIVYLAGLHGHFVHRIFAAPLVSIAGGMCYSVYLTHGTVLAIVTTVLAGSRISALPLVMQRMVVIGTSLSAVFLIGTVFFLLVERPCMDPLWPRKVVASLRGRYQ
jgi:peptidoglycan/LPS O-acetylase OafA/YrhL